MQALDWTPEAPVKVVFAGARRSAPVAPRTQIFARSTLVTRRPGPATLLKTSMSPRPSQEGCTVTGPDVGLDISALNSASARCGARVHGRDAVAATEHSVTCYGWAKNMTTN
jgi:hypothetical protein